MTTDSLRLDKFSMIVPGIFNRLLVRYLNAEWSSLKFLACHCQTILHCLTFSRDSDNLQRCSKAHALRPEDRPGNNTLLVHPLQSPFALAR